jgi:hypothetical protein
VSPVKERMEMGMSLYRVDPLDPVSRAPMRHISVGDELGTALGDLLSLGEELGVSLGANVPFVGVDVGRALGTDVGVPLGSLLGRDDGDDDGS